MICFIKLLLFPLLLTCQTEVAALNAGRIITVYGLLFDTLIGNFDASGGEVVF
ncbi:MAG TPA: hypothetical protein VJT71_19120 [Pyrinomonadaceae bacterium]|nr:hypothetical protein [Pyrinomonadaceae bacterium]